MTTTIPGGLGFTLGVSEEVTPGTALAPTRWFSPHPGETLANNKVTFQSKALYGGLSLRGDRRVLVYSESAGSMEFDLMEKTMGLIWRHITGSNAVAVQQGVTAAWLQQHAFNDTGGVRGKSLCFQKGIPEVPSGTVVPFTYAGCKILDWELNCKVGEAASIKLTIDGTKAESTSVLTYTNPSFVTGNKIMHFGEGAVLLAGTPTTSSGVCSIAGGTAPTGLVSEVMVKGTRKMNTKRVNIGSSSKQEQLENEFYELTGHLVVEFATVADYKTAELADTQQALQVSFTDPTAIASTYYPYTQIIIPNAVFDSAPTTAKDTDVIKATVPFRALYDGTNPTFEVDVMSTDVAV